LLPSHLHVGSNITAQSRKSSRSLFFILEEFASKSLIDFSPSFTFPYIVRTVHASILEEDLVLSFEREPMDHILLPMDDL